MLWRMVGWAFKKCCVVVYLLIALHVLPLIAAAVPSDVQYSLKRLANDKNYVEIKNTSALVLCLKYATDDNFTKTNLYGDFSKCYLHRVAEEKLKKAVSLLTKKKPGWKFVIFDALRPRSVQRLFWDRVKGTSLQRYVANPDRGSVHNYGLALDIGLMDEKGQMVDMGTSFDEFSLASEPRNEDECLKDGRLSSEQVRNRRILRGVMTSAGFTQLPYEWWHFDALPIGEIKSKIPIVE